MSVRHGQESRISRNLEKYWPRSLPLARKNWIFILFLFSIFKILKKKFSFSSRNSRFGKKFSFSSRRNEILQTDSLSLLDSSLNVFSNSREKSYFALWVDFDHQCFAERESILKRQFCVVEQYSDFSLQKHFMETTTTKSLLWEGMVAQWKGQMQNMQEWDRRLICMESEDQRRRRRDWISYCM